MTLDPAIRTRMVSSLTRLADRNKRNSYSAFALYLEALDRVEAEIASGETIRRAILNNFNDRAADACLKAAGLPIAIDAERL